MLKKGVVKLLALDLEWLHINALYKQNQTLVQNKKK
jgi:hypothetical protein